MRIILQLGRPDQVSLTNFAGDPDNLPPRAIPRTARVAQIARRIVMELGQRHCVMCGCSDNHACAGGCSWVLCFSQTPTGVCSRCWGRFVKMIDTIETGVDTFTSAGNYSER